MGRPGRPAKSLSPNRVGNVNVSTAVPAHLFEELRWLSDLWQRQANTKSEHIPIQYWSVGKVLVEGAKRLIEFERLNNPELDAYFERCRQRDSLQRANSGRGQIDSVIELFRS